MPIRLVFILLLLVLAGAGAVLPLLAGEIAGSDASARLCEVQRCQPGSPFNALQSERARRFAEVFRN